MFGMLCLNIIYIQENNTLCIVKCVPILMHVLYLIWGQINQGVHSNWFKKTAEVDSLKLIVKQKAKLNHTLKPKMSTCFILL